MRHLLAAVLLAACTPLPVPPSDAAPCDVATTPAADVAPPCPIGPHERGEWSADAGRCVYDCVGGWARCHSRLCDTDIDNTSEDCGGCGLDCTPNVCRGGACARQ